MSLRILSAGLALVMLVLVGGCHSTQSRYCPPATVAASPPCGAPCSTCGTPPPPGTITAVPGY